MSKCFYFQDATGRFIFFSVWMTNLISFKFTWDWSACFTPYMLLTSRYFESVSLQQERT